MRSRRATHGSARPLNCGVMPIITRDRFTRLTTVIGLCSGVLGCVTTSAPLISAAPGADRVLVMRYGSTLDSSCILAGTAEASDGRFGRDRAAYEGTFERASTAIRNAAAAIDANVALIVRTPIHPWFWTRRAYGGMSLA
jgi:hypothetical protein